MVIRGTVYGRRRFAFWAEISPFRFAPVEMTQGRWLRPLRNPYRRAQLPLLYHSSQRPAPAMSSRPKWRDLRLDWDQSGELKD